MKCSAWQRKISDYIDGALSRADRSRLEEHLQSCRDCRDVLKDFRYLVDEAGRMKEFPPPAGSWLRIAAGMDQGKAPLFPRRLRWSFAAAIVLIALSSAFYVGFRLGRISRVNPLSGGDNNVLSKLDEAEHHYRNAIQALAEALILREGDIDPEVKAVFRNSIEIVNASLVSCKKAVSRDPGDLESRDFLLAVYKEKMDLIAKMITIYENSSSGMEAEKEKII